MNENEYHQKIMNTVLVTYLYPKAISFVEKFIKSVNSQTDDDFEVVIFNDGVDEPENYFKGLKANLKIIEMTREFIPAVRYDSFEFLKETDYENIIFQDIDDVTSRNRIECLKDKLKQFSIVCNDLSIRKTDVGSENIWAERLGDNFIFEKDFLREKNILGLGNSAIRKEVLETNLDRNSNVIATDWFVFYQWLKPKMRKAIFTTECHTIYIQHANNIAGISKTIAIDKKRRDLLVKKEHYKALIKIDPSFKKELEPILKIENEGLVYKEVTMKHYPFWWE